MTRFFTPEIWGQRETRRDKASKLEVYACEFFAGGLASWEFKAITQQKMLSPSGDFGGLGFELGAP